MRRSIIISFAMLLSFAAFAQGQDSISVPVQVAGSRSSAAAVTIPQAYKGWPGHDDITDLKGCFANPPKGYGNVPFYWWTGDTLNLARLEEQLEILADASTDGLCVSYNHTHADVDVELNAQGHGPCGRVSGGKPRVMSDEWFDIWNRFSAKCAEKGIGLGMDDYVIAWPGNGDFADSVLTSPEVRDYQGALEIVKIQARERMPKNALTVFSRDKDSTSYICTTPAPWLHPEIGRKWCEQYFDKFSGHMDDAGRAGINYFFQDELQYDLDIRSWCEDMPQQFMARKGYDIVPLLSKIFITDPDQVDAEAARVRLDYAEVLTQLAEERFFKPIYDWGAAKGLIYGCDNEGRGLNPTRYLDYFRAVSWFTAPGNDAPSRGSSFTQTKVSSSIAHLYGRPRTWLEAFHSIGWDANGALLKHQLDHHIIAGGNLLCMHGLYYSTHGGWWEWAPPCFHFRMPYWEHMKLWLKYAERLCFILSQGAHVCDVAVMYPTETMQAVPGTDAWSTFDVTDALSTHGIDYDFIDYQSLQKAQIVDGSLKISNESYKVLILADTRAMHAETLEKVKAFMQAGGIVIASGYAMPEISGSGATTVADASDAVSRVRSLVNEDFRTESGFGRVLHRRIGERDVYMVMDVRKGEKMHFRAHGLAECWDAMDGSCRALPVLETDAEGSWIRYEGEDNGSMLVVFSPGNPVMSNIGTSHAEPARIQRIAGEWDVTIVPTMDNKWGDFRLPASEGCIGVESREVSYFSDINEIDWKKFPSAMNGYGDYMMSCTVDASEDIVRIASEGARDADWKPYSWSWKYGVADSPGSQGWHGLKAKVDPRFLILDQGGHQLFKTNVYAPETGKYRIVVEGVSPSVMLLDGSAAKEGKIRLGKGWHTLLLAYADTEKKDYSLQELRGSTIDRRDRSMVMFYPASSPKPKDCDLYDLEVASRWYGTDFLPYDINAGSSPMHMQFQTAPGTTDMRFRVNGRIGDIFVDGKPVKAETDGKEVTIKVNEVNPGVGTVTLTAMPDIGYPGAAFFDGPVMLNCSGGRMPEGDWTQFGAMGYYSGGVIYSKDITMDPGDGAVVLDLGEVDATCEVSVGGAKVKTLIAKPYSLDITEYVKPGANHIEVLVYSTLANHYRTIPSPYRGVPRSGLIGPVRILYF